MHLGDVIVRKIGMEQCKADRCFFRLSRDGGVVMIVCINVDDITVAGESEACDFLSTCLLEEFQTTGGELSWYLGRAFERHKKEAFFAQRKERLSSLLSVDMELTQCLISRFELFNDWGGRGYDDPVPGEVPKTPSSGDRTT